MKKLGVVGIATVTLLVGVGIGAAGAEGETASKPVTVPEAEVVTETVTVTETETVEVETTPAACLEALRHAEDVFIHASDFANLVSKYPPLIEEAYTAGVSSGSVYGILSEMQRLTAKNRTLNTKVNRSAAAYVDAAKTCRTH